MVILEAVVVLGVYYVLVFLVGELLGVKEVCSRLVLIGGCRVGVCVGYWVKNGGVGVGLRMTCAGRRAVDRLSSTLRRVRSVGIRGFRRGKFSNFSLLCCFLRANATIILVRGLYGVVVTFVGEGSSGDFGTGKVRYINCDRGRMRGLIRGVGRSAGGRSRWWWVWVM